MPDAVIVIKDRVEHYKNLLKRKEELNKEFLSWKELYIEMEKVLNTVRSVYEKDRTEEAKKELDSWLKEEKDYLEMINEHQKMLDEVNKELNEYDSNTLDEQADYLANLTRFQEISDKMKEIQKRSLKLAGNATIGTNIVMLENAEGRKKRINESFAPEYTRLVEEKRALAKVIRRQRNSIINKVDEVAPQVVDNTLLANATPTIISSDNNEVVIYKNILEDEKFETLSYEERIEKLEAEMARMKSLSGRKQIVKYRGEKIYLPRHTIGKYLLYAREVTKLKNKIEQRDLKTKDYNSLTPYEKYLLSLSSDKLDIYSDSSLVSKSLEEIKLDEEFDKQNEELFAMVNAHSAKYHQSINDSDKKKEEKNKGFLKILNKRKPKNKTSLKEKIKKAVIGIAATLIVMIAATPIVTLVKDLIKKGENTDEESLVNNSSVVSQLTEDEVKDLTNEITSEIKENEKTQNTVNYREAYFSQEFVISKDAPVYIDQYDAYLNRNQLDPYFGEELIRKVSGISIKVGDELKFYYENDSDEKIKELNDNLISGGEVVAVFGTNVNGIEGFYNIQDVHLNKGLGGNSR